MLSKIGLKDVVLKFHSSTEISIKDIYGEAPTKEQEKMWEKFLKDHFKIKGDFSPDDKRYDLETEYHDEIFQLHKKKIDTDIEYFFYRPKNFKL